MKTTGPAPDAFWSESDGMSRSAAAARATAAYTAVSSSFSVPPEKAAPVNAAPVNAAPVISNVLISFDCASVFTWY